MLVSPLFYAGFSPEAVEIRLYIEGQIAPQHEKGWLNSTPLLEGAIAQQQEVEEADGPMRPTKKPATGQKQKRWGFFNLSLYGIRNDCEVSGEVPGKGQTCACVAGLRSVLWQSARVDSQKMLVCFP